jgi:hypothetical protein
MGRDSNILSMDEKAIDLIVRIQEHFISNALMGYCSNVIEGDDSAMAEGIQYGLWKSTDIDEETDLITHDLAELTGTKIEDLSGDNFNKAISATTHFFISNMYKYVFVKDKITYTESVKNIQKHFKNKKRDKKLEMWLRFYLRIKYTVIKEPDEETELIDEHGYIG